VGTSVFGGFVGSEVGTLPSIAELVAFVVVVLASDVAIEALVAVATVVVLESTVAVSPELVAATVVTAADVAIVDVVFLIGDPVMHSPMRETLTPTE